MATLPSILLERRRTERLPIALPVQICSSDSKGATRREHTKTLDVSRKGACLHTRVRRPVGSRIRLGLLPAQRVCLCRVAWVSSQPDEEGFYRMGVEMSDVENFWPIQFPPQAPA